MRISDEGHVVIVGAQTEIAVGQEKVVRGNGKTYTLCFRLTCNVFKRIKLLYFSLCRDCVVLWVGTRFHYTQVVRELLLLF